MLKLQALEVVALFCRDQVQHVRKTLDLQAAEGSYSRRRVDLDSPPQGDLGSLVHQRKGQIQV